MALNSKIEWTHHTANLWWGCTSVHEGCDNCYAEKLAHRFEVKWGNDALRKPVKSVWGKLFQMQAMAEDAGEKHRVFVGSMMDISEKPMRTVDGGDTGEIRDKFFEEVVPACPDLIFLLLTKRPSNINKYIPRHWRIEPPKNVAFGTSVVNEKTAENLHKHLMGVEGNKFYSVEPQLDFIDFSQGDLLEGIDWLIQGGESGPKKRPFDLAWARHTRDVCAQFHVPYFFKQIDKVQPIPDDLQIRQFPKW